MIYIDRDTHKPMFATRKDRARIKKRSELVMQDSTAIVALVVVAMAGMVLLMLIASPWMTSLLLGL